MNYTLGTDYATPTQEQAEEILAVFEQVIKQPAALPSELSNRTASFRKVKSGTQKVVSGWDGSLISQPSDASLIKLGIDSGMGPTSQLDMVFKKQTYNEKGSSLAKGRYDIEYCIYSLNPAHIESFQQALQTVSPLKYIHILKYYPVTGNNYTDFVNSVIPPSVKASDTHGNIYSEFSLPMQIVPSGTGLFKDLLYHVEDNIREFFNQYANRILKFVRNNDSFEIAANVLQAMHNSLVAAVRGAALSSVPLTIRDVKGTALANFQLSLPDDTGPVRIIAPDNKTYSPVGYITDYLVNSTRSKLDSALHTLASSVAEIHDTPDYRPPAPDLPKLFISGQGYHLPEFSPSVKKKKNILFPVVAGATLFFALKG